jgi:hypothetical protein
MVCFGIINHRLATIAPLPLRKLRMGDMGVMGIMGNIFHTIHIIPILQDTLSNKLGHNLLL